MSMSAVFSYAPVRNVTVGPSYDSGQLSYRTPGIGIQVYDKDRTLANFLAVTRTAHAPIRADYWSRSYAEITVEVMDDKPLLIASFADACVQCHAPALNATPQTPRPNVRVVSARASIVPKKANRISLEV